VFALIRRSSPRPQQVVHGTVERGYEPLSRAFGRALQAEHRGGGALVVQEHGRTVVDIWTGWADRERTRAWTSDTPAMSFSTTKGVTATVMHRLADRGLIDYDAPVAEYWPEFAIGGKSAITVADVLTHRADLYDARSIARTAEQLLDHEELEHKLAAARARPTGDHPAYHGLTFGWLCAGIARRVTGQGMAELFRSEVAEPLQLEGIHLGRPKTGPDPAEFIGSLRLLSGPAARLLLPVGSTRITPTSKFVRALCPRGMAELIADGGDRALDTDMPSANGVFTALALASMYAALAGDGGDFLSAETVRALGKIRARKRDEVLGLPMAWRLGYHHAFTTHRRSRRGFGHYGLGGSGGFADPQTGLSFGFVTNRLDVTSLSIGNITTVSLADVALLCAISR
jgi:CubicO group peptidase (beta-lactamase class C family)